MRLSSNYAMRKWLSIVILTVKVSSTKEYYPLTGKQHTYPLKQNVPCYYLHAPPPYLPSFTLPSPPFPSPYSTSHADTTRRDGHFFPHVDLDSYHEYNPLGTYVFRHYRPLYLWNRVSLTPPIIPELLHLSPLRRVPPPPPPSHPGRLDTKSRCRGGRMTSRWTHQIVHRTQPRAVLIILFDCVIISHDILFF